MRLQRRSIRMGLLCLTAGTVFQLFGTCAQSVGQAALMTIDPCAILDCTGGILNGALNPCGVVGDTSDDIFVKCP